MSELVEKITEEIRKQGVISFARFMELALYCPVYGYYEKEEDTIGRCGDYYTSASVGSLLGELLGVQFADWLQARPLEDRETPLRIVEAGAHSGKLAKDILDWLRVQQAGLYEQIEYWILEPSERRRQRQRQTLSGLVHKVRWASDFGGLAEGPSILDRSIGGRRLRGIVFSNELLDAMPVQRVVWDATRSVWFEQGVTLSEGRFVWARMADLPSGASTPLPKVPSKLLKVMPDGFTLDICPAAGRWWRQAADSLKWGKLLAIDYGLSAEEFLLPERRAGTLRAYRRHHLVSDVLAVPGQQDLTAHVNFSGIRKVGEAAGLKTETWLTQEQFLTGIVARVLSGEVVFGEWTAASTRQFQTLSHPDHLGRPFRVLVQSREC